MSSKSIFVGLDIGTTKVCTLVGSFNDQSEIEILGIGNKSSNGIRKGSVVNIDRTIQSISSSISEAQLMSGFKIDEATIGISGSHVHSFNSIGVVAIKNEEITEEDIQRAIEAARAVIVPSDREIIHAIPQEFKVDNTSGIKDPIGMCGVRLEVDVHIITGSVNLVQNLIKCVESTGIKVKDIMLQQLASSNSVLETEEKDMGCVLLDIGGGTTDLAVWKEGNLVHTQVIPVGGNHFTNDLAIALKVPHSEAEKVKLKHGNVFANINSLNSEEPIRIKYNDIEREFSKDFISRVLRARAEELFDIVKDILDKNDLMDELNSGVIITGGGSLLSGLTDLCDSILERPTKLGVPYGISEITNLIQNPRYSTSIGLIMESSNMQNFEGNKPNENKSDIIQKLSTSLKSVFEEIF